MQYRQGFTVTSCNTVVLYLPLYILYLPHPHAVSFIVFSVRLHPHVYGYFLNEGFLI